MSAKQLRKLKELRDAEAAAAALAGSGIAAEKAAGCRQCVDGGSDLDAAGADSASHSASEDATQDRTARFALLASDSDGESSASSSRPPSVSSHHNVADQEPCGSAPVTAKPERHKRKADQTGDGATSGRDRKEDSDDELLLAAAAGDDEAAEDSLSSTAFEAGVLAMRRCDFSVESERRRVTGRSGLASIAGVPGGNLADGPNGAQRRRFAVQSRSGGEGRTAHHRRLFLVVPTSEEPWPRPDDNAVMKGVVDEQGAAIFDVEDTKKSKKSLDRLHDCLRSEDPQAVQHLLEQQPFCIDALLVMAEYFRGQRQNEQAFKLVRRAVYAVECGFGPGFSPFQESAGDGQVSLRPRTSLALAKDMMWPGWSWLTALWMYMHGLASQGMHRTGLEVCKLLLAMTLPRDPSLALLSCDFLCLRSKQYETLSRLNTQLVSQYGFDTVAGGIVTRLDLILPNFAYSIALASMLKAGSATPSLAALNQVAVADVIAVVPGSTSESQLEEDSEAAAHVQLLRALLLFPMALRPLLDEMGLNALHGLAPGGSISRDTWSDLLSRPPFVDASDFRHADHAAAHARICSAYAKRCGVLWKPDSAARWLHACAARLCKMHESTVFADDLISARKSWRETPLCLDEALSKDYVEVLPEHGAAEDTALPQMLKRASQARLQPKVVRFINGQRVQDDTQPTISLHSPAVLIFFQSLLPWGELDRSGVVLERYAWSDIGRDGIGALRFMGIFLAGAACDLARLLGPALAWAWATARALVRIPEVEPAVARVRDRRPRGRRR